MLERYRMARQEVEDKERQLEEELAELEEIREDLNNQKEELDALIAEKKETAEDFAAQLSKAKSRAGEVKAQISQQSENLKKLNQAEAEKIAEEARKKAEEEARKKAEEAAAKKRAEEEAASSKKSSDDDDDDDDSSHDSSSSDSGSESRQTGTSVTATGSGTGTDIANYALQYVGCPYVAGGTSLSEGCDCSGFTQGVYSHFGIKIPRSSYAQSAGGEEVSYDDAHAGDIIYYGGHVGIYIGNNLIVHASTAATGIKISSAFYKYVLSHHSEESFCSGSHFPTSRNGQHNL